VPMSTAVARGDCAENAFLAEHDFVDGVIVTQAIHNKIRVRTASAGVFATRAPFWRMVRISRRFDSKR
jgi:hypothetical protein